MKVEMQVGCAEQGETGAEKAEAGASELKPHPGDGHSDDGKHRDWNLGDPILVPWGAAEVETEVAARDPGWVGRGVVGKAGVPNNKRKAASQPRGAHANRLLSARSLHQLPCTLEPFDRHGRFEVCVIISMLQSVDRNLVAGLCGFRNELRLGRSERPGDKERGANTVLLVDWQQLAQTLCGDSDLPGCRQPPAAAETPVKLLDVVGDQQGLHSVVSRARRVVQTLDIRQGR
jgi:hypothetical protein